ncbi:hypothetical protein GUITHDRAFT_120402 [Guillardia theta CCMP2712]|uniref:Uncharacterized protein n=3 Tax=Guillardia theta TaxID=55529 RepID=L1IB05_GUITC|nr:hypothetical protein GUITHDRAFT_120402 [Guillardia theta CCMP2712]EKX33398.1 hypothetical protein GUITHDRAFT_120402 [Guillardia theta CCMP2712]|eukprot:XP_005820378.1 hypothetical protein GUITHDRAFT_120402 [Guillardia theta CCMP2712]
MGDRALDEEEDENVASESTGPTQSPELALALAQVKRVKEKLADARIRGESDKKLKHDLGLQLVRLSEQVQEHQDQASELAVEIQNRMKIRCETNEWMETKRMKDELNSYRDQRISRIARQTPFASSPLRIGPWRVDPGRYEDFKNLKVVEQINKAASESLSRCSENEVSCEEFSSSTPALLLRENADLTWLLCSAIERRAKLDKQLEDAHVSGRSGGLDDVIRPFVGSEASTRGWMEFSPRHGSRESSPSSSAAATKSPLLLEPKRLFNSGAPSNSGGQDEGGKRERDWTLRGIKGSIMNRLARLESPQPPPSSSSSSPINSKRVELEAVDLGAVVSSLSRFMEEGTYLLVSQLEDVRQARKEVESESAGLQEECERMERELARLQSERDDAVARAAADAKIKLELAEQERKKQLRKDVGAMP